MLNSLQILGTATAPMTCTHGSYVYEQCPNTLRVPYDFIRTELALSKDSIDERYRNLTHSISKCSSTHHHLHLEHITLGLRHRYDVPQYGEAIEPANVSANFHDVKFKLMHTESFQLGR